MTQARRPAGTPVGGQFAPTNRPEASGIELVDDDPVSRRRVVATVATGIPSFSVEGLRDRDCREIRDRVRTALLLSDFAWPMGRITVRVSEPSPRRTADLGLEIALGLLQTSGQLPDADVGGLRGELGLDGSIRGEKTTDARSLRELVDSLKDRHGSGEIVTTQLSLFDIAQITGTPAGGQFAPTNRPEATGVELVDDDIVGEAAGEAPPHGAPGLADRRLAPHANGERPAGTATGPRRYRQATTVREGSRSPWGTVDYVSRRAVGITHVGTAGHGGVKLSPERNRDVHEAWRRPDGWYEEDCEWAIVAVTFPECYSPEHAATAHTTARNWFPDEYEVVTGEQIQPGESHVRDEQIFNAEHANDWVTTAAVAIEEPGTVERIVRDDGVTGGFRLVRGEQPMVKVWARVGGRYATGPKTRAFLVPEADYDTRGRFGFVVDPDKYLEIAT